MKTKIEYGNWVSKKIMKMLIAGSISIIAVFILLCCNFVIYETVPMWAMLTIRIIVFLFIIFIFGFTLYIYICRKLFSGNHGNVSAQIINMVADRLDNKVKGKILDIGCGSGALSIAVAKRFPENHITGIDFWGSKWDYAKEQCENNAKTEGVIKRTEFMKGDAAALPFSDETFDGAVSNFVFHEVKTAKDKRDVIREALRVVKKGGAFAFHDLFYQKSLYGDIEEFVKQLKAEGITEIEVYKTVNEKMIRNVLKTNIMLNNIGMIYGIK